MSLSRLLVIAGLVLLVAGVLVGLLQRAHVPFGRLPGDIVWRGRNTTVYFPWVSCLVLSLLGTLVLWLIGRGR